MTKGPACAELEPAEADILFFARFASRVAAARRMCRACPVAAACLELAMQAEGDEPAGYRFGVYGGTTAEERAAAVGANTTIWRRSGASRARA